MPLLVSVITFLLVTLTVLIGYQYWQQHKRLNKRLDIYGDEVEAKKAAVHVKAADKESLLWRGIKQFAKVIKEKTSGRLHAKLSHQLIMAGNPGNLQPAEFIALKIIICLLAAIAGIIIRLSLLNFVLITAVAWLIPDIYIKQLIKKRQLAIGLAMPDVLDLLTVSVEAGLGFDSAVAKVVEKQTGPLADEFRRMLYEMRIGKPRRQALKSLSERTGVDYLQSFVSAVIQADQLGVSISKVLRIQSNEIRRQRRQKAEEAAMKAPIKMLIPLVGLVFPALFIILLGPALLSFMSNL